jgi:hypothetical protein
MAAPFTECGAQLLHTLSFGCVRASWIWTGLNIHVSQSAAVVCIFPTIELMSSPSPFATPLPYAGSAL